MEDRWTDHTFHSLLASLSGSIAVKDATKRLYSADWLL